MKKQSLNNGNSIQPTYSRKKIICLILFMFYSFFVFSQINPKKFTRQILISKDDIEVKSFNNLQSVSIKNWAKSTEIGTPQLPLKYELIFIPDGYAATIKYSVNKTRTFHQINLCKSVPQNIDTQEIPPYNPDSIKPYPIIDKWFFEAPVSIDRIIEYRGQKLALIKISPIQYNPKRKNLVINYDIEYTILFKSIETKNNDLHQPEIKQRDINTIRRWIINTQQLSSNIKQQNTNSNYLIITYNNFKIAADTLALWKRECGYNVLVVSQDFWTSSKIKDTVSYFYHCVNFCPDYVCFLGDHDFVPGTEKIAPQPLPEMFATDLYYVCMGGQTDFFPDIAYGRISVSNSNEALLTVKKIIKYEKSPPQNSAFYQNASHCSFFQDENFDTYDDRRFVQTSEEIRNYIQQNTNIQVQQIYEANSDVTPLFWNNGLYSSGEPIPNDLQKPFFPWNGSTSDIINAINYGRLYLFHRDHGYSNATGWAHPSFLSSQIQYLFNLNQLPLIISINCHTGEFSKPECFAEKMLRSTTGGCFGIFAPSFYSYSGYNDAISLGIFDGFWNNPGINPNFTGSGGTPTPDFDNSLSSNKPGDVLIHSLIYSTLHWGFNQHTNEIMHYFGDPATAFYTTLPETIIAELSDTIFCNSQSYFIQTQNCQNCIASISLNNQLVASSQIINDTLTLNFNAMYGDTAYLTITGLHKRPIIKPLKWFCNQPVYAPIANFSSSDSIACNREIHFFDNSLHFPQQWLWDFGDGIISNIQNPSHLYNENGYYSVKLKTTNIHGTDSIIKYNIIHVYTPQQPLYSDTLLCQPSSLTLSSISNQTVFWYSDYEHQNLLDTGLSIYFNNINQNTNIYPFTKNIISNLSIGILNNLGQGGYIFNNKKNYLVFHAQEDFVLSSIKIYSNTIGNKAIELSDSIGNILNTKIFNFSIGENIVPLNFSIQNGKRYRLIGPTFSNFHATNSGVQFPYTMPFVLSIDSSSSTNPLDTYYYFYDWKINRTCFSNPDTLTIIVQNIDTTITPAGQMVLCPNSNSIAISTNSGIIANWSNGEIGQSITTSQTGLYSAHFTINTCNYFTDTLIILEHHPISTNFSISCQNNSCNFTNSSLNAIWYFWDFGDGNYSTLANPTHVFADTGSYDVHLMAFTNCDTVISSQLLLIDALKLSEQNSPFIEVYPNPFVNEFHVSNPLNRMLNIRIFDTEGQVIQEFEDTKTEFSIKMNPYSNGVYFIEIKTITEILRIKVLKMKDSN